MTKARHDGAAYVYSLLTGYKNPATYRNEKGHPLPAANRPGQGLHFNPYFPNLNLAMPAPLTSDGQVTYAPGNPAPTVDQMAKDVSAFLVWTAEPKLARRHASGVAVVIFLLVATALGYFAYQNVWRQQKAKVRMTGVLDPENQAKTRRAKGKAGIKG
jgi:ubiquinol-cytochrome c reductase cytochrome c1 subunit